MLEKKKKDRIIAKFKTHSHDTGSPEVQIALLTAEISELTAHLKLHKKDFSSRRGLVKKVAQRRKLLHYLQREDAASYDQLAKRLKIKRRSPLTLMPLEEQLEMAGNEAELPATDELE